jgi:hypothetical protein
MLKTMRERERNRKRRRHERREGEREITNYGGFLYGQGDKNRVVINLAGTETTH